MPKRRLITTYYIDVRISVPSPAGGDPRPAWDAAHGAVKGLRAALPAGAYAEITHTGTGKMEAVTTNGPQIGPSLNPSEQRKEISPQANDGNDLAPKTAQEEISRPPIASIAAEATEIPEHMRRVPRFRSEG